MKVITAKDVKPRRVFGKLTPERKQKLVDLLSQTGNLSACAAACGITTPAVYSAMDVDPNFKEAITLAREQANARIEREMMRRGLDGIDRDIYYKGEKVGVQKEFSDRLLLQMAKANMPERHSEKSIQIVDQSISVANSARAKLANLLGIDMEQNNFFDSE